MVFNYIGTEILNERTGPIETKEVWNILSDVSWQGTWAVFNTQIITERIGWVKRPEQGKYWMNCHLWWSRMEQALPFLKILLKFSCNVSQLLFKFIFKDFKTIQKWELQNSTSLCSSLSLSSALKGDRRATQPVVTNAWLSPLDSYAHTSPGLSFSLDWPRVWLPSWQGLIIIKRVSGWLFYFRTDHSAMPGDVAQTFPVVPPESSCPCTKIRDNHTLERLSGWAQLPAVPVLFNLESPGEMQLQHEFLALKH